MKHLSNHTERMISMAYNWHKMVTITVPVGLNGWLYSGQITINGITTKFPVGVETSLPEPVAAMIQQMIAVEEDNKIQTPDNLHTGSVTIPAGKKLKLEAGALVEDEAGVLGTGGGTSTVVVLEETTLTRDETDDGNSYYLYTPFNIRLEAGKTYNVNYNGTGYDCPAVTLVTGENGETAVVLGNISIAGLEGGNADAPFIMIEFAPDVAGENGPFANVVDTSGATSVTISITQEAAAASTGGGGFIIKGTLTGATINENEFALATDKSYADTTAALNAGQYVALWANMDGANMVLHPAMILPEQITFVMNDGANTLIANFNADDSATIFQK